MYRNSITTRYLLIIGIILLLVQLLFGAYQVGNNYQQEKATLENRVQTHANFLADVTPEWVFSGDFLSLETLMRQTSQEPDIVYAIIRENDGRFLTRYLNRDNPFIATAIASTPSPQILDILNLVRKNPSVNELRAPIVSENVQLGEVWVAYSTITIENNLLYSALRIILISLIVTAVLIILTIWQFRVLIHNPLTEVIDQANALANGNLDTRATVLRNNEISQLKITFNDMAEQLQKTLTTLRQQEAEAQKLSNVASRTDNMVIIADANGTIEWVNKSFERITEYTLEEVVGQRPGQILQGPDTDRDTIAFMRQKIHDHESFVAQVINYSKSGRAYWVELEVQTVFDDNGELINFIAIESDITARKEAEEQLKAYAHTLEQQNKQLARLANEREEYLQEITLSEARYRDLFENAYDLIQSVDKEGAILYVNQSWLDLLGYTVEESTTLNIHDVLRHDQFSICESVFAQCYQGKDVANTQLVYCTKRGQEIILEGNVTAQIENGELISTRGIFRDVTERVHFDAILKVNEARMRGILNAAMDCIISIDELGRIIEFNPAAEKVFGYKYDDAIGSYLVDLLVPSDLRQAHKNGLQRYLTTRQPKVIGKRVELRAMHADGHQFPIEIAITPIEIDDEIIFTAFLRDISERKKTEESLRQSETRYRGVVESQAELVCRYQSDFTLTFVNEAYCHFAQRSRETLIGQSFLMLFPPHERDLVEKRINSLMETHETIIQEHHVSSPENQWYWQQWSYQAIVGDKGNVLEIQAVGQDITPIKQAQIELQRALEKEKELGELKSRFVSMASHEFRTPLTTIMSTASFLEMAQMRISADKQLKRLQKIQGAAQNMTTLIDEVLTYGKAEAGRLLFHPEHLNLHEFCSQVVEDMQAILGQHTIHYHNSCPDIVMLLDKKLLQHILTNLLSNAAKYSPNNDMIEFTIDHRNTDVVMEVKDYGIGIPEVDQKHLFQPFHRANNTQNIAGTGLGLSITQKSVLAHGGTIVFESVVNRGTVFTVTLPITHEV